MSKNQIKDASMDLKAFIYQQIEELEEFMTESTTVSVIEKNSKKMVARLKREELVDESFEAKYCYEFQLKEEGERITAYGLADNPFDAIVIAKEKLVKQLTKIQSEVISTSSHINEVNRIASGNYNIH